MEYAADLRVFIEDEDAVDILRGKIPTTEEVGLAIRLENLRKCPACGATR